MAESRVESILATIREAIDKGPEPAPVADARPVPTSTVQASISKTGQGTLMRGAMRELRVNFGEDGEVRDTQINELRDRVQRYAEAQSYTAPQSVFVSPPPLRPTLSEREGFATILTQPLPPHAAVPPRAPSYDYQRPRYQPEAQPAYSPHATPPEYYAQPEPVPTFVDPYAGQYDAEQQWQDAQYQHYEQQQRYVPPEPPRYEPAPRAPRRPSQALVSTRTEQSSRASFDDLSEAIVNRLGGDRGLEDVTRELLRGLLRNWLDEHLPEMVERLVRDEIERVARGR